jgi:hypothetical protein
MTADLRMLTHLMPVPDYVRDQHVDWDALEAAVGLSYPASFKEFVATYGALRWFDRWCPVYCTGKSKREIGRYLDFCGAILKRFQAAPLDEDGNPIAVPPTVYPDMGGLFPFMASCDGDEYCWVTRGDPDAWPVVSHSSGQLRKLGKTTITRMFLDWMQGKKKMERVWWNYQQFAEDQPQCIGLFP